MAQLFSVYLIAFRNLQFRYMFAFVFFYLAIMTDRLVYISRWDAGQQNAESINQSIND
jgi:hypothetical protein